MAGFRPSLPNFALGIVTRRAERRFTPLRFNSVRRASLGAARDALKYSPTLPTARERPYSCPHKYIAADFWKQNLKGPPLFENENPRIPQPNSKPEKSIFELL